jgi:hypothetical protein
MKAEESARRKLAAKHGNLKIIEIAGGQRNRRSGQRRSGRKSRQNQNIRRRSVSAAQAASLMAAMRGINRHTAWRRVSGEIINGLSARSGVIKPAWRYLRVIRRRRAANGARRRSPSRRNEMAAVAAKINESYG